MISIVKFFDTSKGFGFLIPEDGGNDVFFDKIAMQSAGIIGIEKAQRLSYDVQQDERGAWKAVNLQTTEMRIASGISASHSAGHAQQDAPIMHKSAAHRIPGSVSTRDRKNPRNTGKAASELAEWQRKYELYSDLGRSANNDPVAREGYLQHAEHCYRVVHEADG